MGDIFGGDSGGLPPLGLKKLAEYIRNRGINYNNLAEPFFGLEQRRGEFGESFFDQLRQRIENPTVSPLFQLYGKEGLDMLRNTFATTGSPSAGPAQVAGGRFLEGLAAQQLDKGDQMLMAAANFRGQLPVTQEPAYLNSELNTRIARGQAAAATQAQQDSGGFGGLFGNLLGVGLGSFLGPLGSAAGGALGGRIFGGSSSTYAPGSYMYPNSPFG